MRIDEVKFVLSDRADYEFAREFVSRHNLAQARECGAYSRPHFAKMPPAPATARTVCSIRKNWPNGCWPMTFRRAWGLQLHKFIWDPAVKGV